MADREALYRVPEQPPVRFEPLHDDHIPALRAICAEDRETWPIFPVDLGGEGFDAAISRFRDGSWINLAIIDMRSGRLAGLSNYIAVNTDFPDGFGSVEIGGTVLACDLRGTGFNGAMKRAMIGHAFACGFHRVGFNVDDRNARSKAAVLKLGAVQEGIRRKDRATWTGHVRDTACFAILRDDWAG